MTKRNYFQSLGILFAATFYVKTVLSLHWWEAFGLVFLAIVCVVHTIDVMHDIQIRKTKKKEQQDDDGGPERSV